METEHGCCDPTLADGFLRLAHNAHRIEMRGDSMRKGRGKANSQLSPALSLVDLPWSAYDRCRILRWQDPNAFLFRG
jgi:hypothetical protein